MPKLQPNFQYPSISVISYPKYVTIMSKLLFQITLILLAISHLKITNAKITLHQHGPLTEAFLRTIFCANKSKIYYPSQIEQQQITLLHNNVRQSQAKHAQRKPNLLKYNNKLESILQCQLNRCSLEIDVCMKLQNITCQQNSQYYDLSYIGEISYKSAFKNWTKTNCSSDIKKLAANCPKNKSTLRIIDNKLSYLGCGIIKYSIGTIIACAYCPKQINLFNKRQIDESVEDAAPLYIEPHYRKQKKEPPQIDPYVPFSGLNPNLREYNMHENYGNNSDDEGFMGRGQLRENPYMRTMDDDVGKISGSESVQRSDSVEFAKIVLCVHALFIIILF